MYARRAKGKKSVAISDRSGFKVPYRSLKTTWDGLRVEPEEWEPKHPQLTPAKNVIDATALFEPRADNDPDSTEFFVGYNYGDISADAKSRPPVGIAGKGAVGFSRATSDLQIFVVETGLAGTGAVGTESIESDTAGLAGVAGTGAVGTEPLESSITEVGVAGTGAVGTEVPEASITEVGVAGTGAVGSESIHIAGWGNEAWGDGTWGDG